MSYSNNRRYNIRIYFRDSPSPLYVSGVCNMLTEGNLLRVITEDGLSQWWPLCAVFNIRQVEIQESRG